MNSRTTSLNKLIYLLSIVVLFTLVFQNVLMSFAEDTGNINVELKYENGDRVST